MVGFRAYAARLGVDLGLGGWVRNRPDGRLEALVQGPVPATDEFLAFLREGPRAARVETVEAFEEAPSGDLPRFSIDA